MNAAIKSIDDLETPRLTIRRLEASDAAFMFQLVNTPDWIKYIGDKKIDSIPAAASYIFTILDHPQKHYWVISTKEDLMAIGIITFMQRDHLEYPDFGFAFLPSHTRQGYAFEGSKALLSQIIQIGLLTSVFAITLTDNAASIKLLQKLGFVQWNELDQRGERLYAFKLDVDLFDETLN